jgi:hypothetical protein
MKVAANGCSPPCGGENSIVTLKLLGVLASVMVRVTCLPLFSTNVATTVISGVRIDNKSASTIYTSPYMLCKRLTVWY